MQTRGKDGEISVNTASDKYMFKPLSPWSKGKQPLPERLYGKIKDDNPDESWDVWISMEEMGPIYKAKEMDWLSLKDSRDRTQQYLKEASELINGLEGGWLDGEERLMLFKELGEPPKPCLPLYIITCGKGKEEKVVYAGITKNSSRFKGGHLASLKLHHPKYEGKLKRVYRCSIWFHFNGEYIFLDWIQPDSVAVELLDSIESQFIYHFQPELNTRKKKKNYTKWEFSIHIQNFLKEAFLNDTFI
ncbi:MAG: hypothetical protein KAI70_03760 [Candidatus Omnitrophica bacterium]|nr:hypothetical protein [Candidatus Omnitrophota bacterium]